MAFLFLVFTSQTDFFKWDIDKPKNDQVLNVSSDEFTSNLSYPCKSSSDCTFYNTTLPKGYYKVEVWGARGGRARRRGEQTQFFNGGYSVGVLNLTQESQVFVYIGGSGTDAPSPSTGELPGGFNGGGSVPIDNVDGNGETIGDDQGGSGGGSTDIRVGRNDVESRVIVAGGAGGSGYLFNIFEDNERKEAGFGGGLTAGIPISSSTRYPAADQNNGPTKFYGQNGIKDSFSPSGGGGGGYFGGYAGEAGSIAGGGSGYIGGVNSTTDVTKQSIGGNQIIPLPDGTTGIGNPGHGAARITRMRYSIRNTTEIKEWYDTNSNFTIGLEVSSIGPGENATIYRITTNGISSTSQYLGTHADTGHVYQLNDNYTLPNQQGTYNLQYKVLTKDSLETHYSFNITVISRYFIHNTSIVQVEYSGVSKIEIPLEINSIGVGNNATVYRILNETERKIFEHTENDTNNIPLIDKINIRKPDIYNLTYVVNTNDKYNSSINFIFNATKVPITTEHIPNSFIYYASRRFHCR